MGLADNICGNPKLIRLSNGKVHARILFAVLIKNRRTVIAGDPQFDDSRRSKFSALNVCNGSNIIEAQEELLVQSAGTSAYTQLHPIRQLIGARVDTTRSQQNQQT